jgi:hypothetical protein
LLCKAVYIDVGIVVEQALMAEKSAKPRADATQAERRI